MRLCAPQTRLERTQETQKKSLVFQGNSGLSPAEGAGRDWALLKYRLAVFLRSTETYRREVYGLSSVELLL